MKTCTKCGASKPVDEFYVLKVGHSGRINPGRFPECKACNIERVRAWQNEQRRLDPDFDRRRRLKAIYRITLENYESMLAAQGGGCAVCGATEPGGGKGPFFHVDHDHETGKVRGLLCQGCNTGIGNFREDVDRMAGAMAYLLAHQNLLTATVF